MAKSVRIERPFVVEEMAEQVVAPSHYQDVNGGDCLHVINQLGLPFALGNVVKYLWRAGKKPGESQMKDLRKAREYLERYIMYLENGEG